MHTKAFTIIVVSAFCMALNGSGAILDTTFDPGTGANGTINAIAIESGKILIGGTFTSYNGTSVNYIARLNSDGSLDTSFSGTAAGGVNSIVIQNVSGANKILIGGNFTSLKRMNANGTTDTSFSAPTLNHYVTGIALDSNNKIVFGGEFTSVNGYTRMRVARLNSSGSLDSGFDPSYGANNTIYSVCVDSSDKVIVGGVFTYLRAYPYGSPYYPYLGRLNTDGTLDTGFTPSPNNYVYSVLADDNVVLAGGTFTSSAASTRDRFEQFTSSSGGGTTWNSFTSCIIGADATVYAVARESGSYFLVGGLFDDVNGYSRKRIARIDRSSGCIDSWNPDISGGGVYAICVQADGQILIGGTFTSVESTSRNRIARLNY